MATEVLREFRRRFVAAAARNNLLVDFPESADLEASPLVHSVETNDRVLMFGPHSMDAIQLAARRAGPGSTVLNVDDDPTRVPQLRERISAKENTEGDAAIRLVCADWADLRTDLEWVEQKLQAEPVGSLQELQSFKEQLAITCRESPLVRDGCVNLAILPALNLLTRERVFPVLQEVLRVLDNRGRLMLECLVSDEPLTAAQTNPSSNHNAGGHIPTEQQLLAMMEQAGFYGVELTHWDKLPQRIVQGVELRGVEVRAFKGKEGPCYDCHHAVIYRGPWKRVHDDDGHVYNRGERTAVCEKTYRILTSEPYRNYFIPIPPYVAIPVERSVPFDCHGSSTRSPRVTKSLELTGSQSTVAECSNDCAC